MRKKLLNILVLLFYGLIVIIIMTGRGNLYGSSIDWVNQHSVFPEYFRNLFYETKRFLPNLALNIGAGQNIFNFAYYGFLSPIILLSYLMPFVSMTTFIISCSIILYLISAVLVYYFIDKHFNSELAFFAGFIFLSLPPITFQFHHHIMFVWYFPFLLLALIGIDRYFEKGKSILMMLSIFLIIMTNYYFSIACLCSLGVYSLYKIFSYNFSSFKSFFLELFKISIRFIIPILLSSFMLLPIFSTILGTERIVVEKILLKDYILTDLSRFMFGSYGLGISGAFIVALFGNIFLSKKSDVFLNISLLSIITFPFILSLLNGFIYIRGKVLIPFIPLFIYSLISFFDNLKFIDADNVKKIELSVIIYALILCPNCLKNIFCSLEIIGALFLIIHFKNKKKLLKVGIILILLIASFGNNFIENYVSCKEYDKINDTSINQLLEYKDKDDFFVRTSNLISPSKTINKVYDSHYYTTSIYSSTYNNLYHSFYNTDVGNNISSRNDLMLPAANNDFFNTFMGVKYILADNYDSFYYTKLNTVDKKSIYYNKKAFPIIYGRYEIGSSNDYRNLNFPFNVEYLMKRGVVNAKYKDSFESEIKDFVSPKLDKTYKFYNSKEETEVINLPDELKNKILYISFKMNEINDCKIGDSYIQINDIKNTLTCEQWRYNNRNFSFEYIVPATDKLFIKSSLGKFSISEIKINYSDYIDFLEYFTRAEIKNLDLNKKKEEFSFDLNMDKAGYLITSIPYDKGFEIYDNGKYIKKELVNLSFLGAKLTEGKHQLKIIYKAPLYKEGIIVSLVGALLLIIIILKEQFFKKQKK